MVKIKTSLVQKKSIKNTPKLRTKKAVTPKPYNPVQELLNETLIRDAIWECLQNDDSEGVIKVLKAHLEAVGKEALCRDASLARSTFYHSLKAKNPTLKTLAKLVSAVHARPH